MLEHNYAGSRCRVYRERLLHCSSRLPLCLFTAVFIACLVACGGSNKPTVPGPPPGTQHLYTNGALGHAVQFALPVTSSTPTATLSIPTASNASALAVDSAGNVAVGAIDGSISIFNAPVTGAASASATFKNGTSTSVENLAFNSAGDLFATTFSNSINVFTHPLTSASTPSQVITSVNLNKSDGIVLDSANNLIVSNLLPGPTASNLLVYAPPYTGLPIATATVPAATYRQMAISGTQLFVVNSQVSLSKINVYNLPITAGSDFAFLISNNLTGGSATGDGVAMDSSGNLYAGLSGNTGPPDVGDIRIYVPPFSAASAPTVANGVFGTSLAIGK
jgi:sugar lactone lactonase YvrE